MAAFGKVLAWMSGMKQTQARPLAQPVRRHLAGNMSEAQAGVLCYLFGPFSSLMLLFSRHGHPWSVRFHAIHSTVLTALWAAGWGTLRLVEEITPWFLSTVMRELRFAMNLGFLFLWVCLLASAYFRVRCAVAPYLHSLSVRLARRWERHDHGMPAPASAH